MLKKLLKAPEGSAQQGFHLVSFGQDENLVIIGCGFLSFTVCQVACRLEKNKKRGKREKIIGLGKGKLFTHFYWLCVVAKMRNVLACVLDLLSE